jgi:hypothetical protein
MVELITTQAIYAALHPLSEPGSMGKTPGSFLLLSVRSQLGFDVESPTLLLGHRMNQVDSVLKGFSVQEALVQAFVGGGAREGFCFGAREALSRKNLRAQAYRCLLSDAPSCHNCHSANPVRHYSDVTGAKELMRINSR